MLIAVSMELDAYNQVSQFEKSARSLFKEAVAQHFSRLLRDAATTTTDVRQKKRQTDVDVMNAAARGAEGDLKSCVEWFAQAVRKPPLFELHKATYMNFRKAAAIQSFHPSLRDSLVPLITEFMKKVLEAAMKSAIDNDRTRVNAADFKHALSICSRTLM